MHWHPQAKLKNEYYFNYTIILVLTSDTKDFITSNLHGLMDKKEIF